MRAAFKQSITQAALALGLGLGSLAPAQAGLVSGYWDPMFGPTLSDLSWSIQADFTVPDACIALGDGVHLTIGGPCGGTTVNSAWLRLFSTSTDTPTDFSNFLFVGGGMFFDYTTLGGGMTASAVRVLNGQVLGVATNTPAPVDFSSVAAAENNLFTLGFTVNAPDLNCDLCLPVLGQSGGAVDVPADLSDLVQVLVTYNDNGSPKLVDRNGDAVGVRMDGQGRPVGFTATPVPEPGALGLVLVALSALGALAWRRRQA